MPSSVNHGLRDLKLRSYKVTLSTKYDIADRTVEKFVNWVRNNAEMHYTVIERGKSGVRHLHSLVCFTVGKARRNLADYFWRHHVKPFNEGCEQHAAVDVSINSDDRWISEYLLKEADVEVKSNDYDRAREAEFYPTVEQQEILQVFVGSRTAVDSFYAEHAGFFTLWFRDNVARHQDVAAATTAHCLQYFYHRMHVSKDMRVMSDPRRVRQQAQALARYVTSDSRLNFEDRKYCAAEHGPVMDFNG